MACLLALLYLALAALAAWVALGVNDVVAGRRPVPRVVQRPPVRSQVPHWARTGHLSDSPSSSASSGRHARKATR